MSASALAVVVVACGALAPSAAIAATGDRWVDDLGSYHEVVYDGDFKDLPYDRIVHADCPTQVSSDPSKPYTPYLDWRAGSDGRDLGSGIKVNDPFAVTYQWTRAARYHALGTSGHAVSGIDVKVATWLIPNPHIYIEMVCTADPTFAWRG